MGDLETRPHEQDGKIILTVESDDLDKSGLMNVLLSKKSKQTIAACIIGAMLASGSIYYYNYRNTGYAVRYQGNLLGYVRDTESAKDALAVVREEINKYDPSISVSDALQFEKMLVSDEKIISSDYIKDTIESGLLVQYTCYSISVNGSEIAIVRNEDEAKKVIDSVKKFYEAQETQNGAEVLNITIKDDIKYDKKVVNATKIVDAQQVVDLLLSGKGTTVQYQVKKGDSIWRIARDNNMTIQEIADVNPGLNVDKLMIGQMVNLSVSEPYLNVETTVRVAVNQDIPYATTYVSDNSLYRGQTKVVKSGEYGTNKITKEVTKLNGNEVASTVLSTELVKNPVTRIMAKGTKELVGTGRFMWPSGGTISSGYGARWGGFHKGLDIAAPYGSPIYAADSGTVTLAGRYYNYGLLVIIDHGNGYTTYYGHCSTLYVNAGDTVKKGEKIAAIGLTGQTTGPHVHFEVRKNGVCQNPLTYLK